MALTFVNSRLFGLLLFITLFLSCACTKIESRLVKHLLSDYNKLIRPVHKRTDIIKLELDLTLHQIAEVNDKAQILTTNVVLQKLWVDKMLQWNVSEFDDIDAVRIPVNLIWDPDLRLYNTAEQSPAQTDKEFAIVLHNGTTMVLSPLILKSICKMDVTWFPFDTKTCDLNFGK